MNEIDLDDYIKKMHENEDSAVKVIEEHKKLLKEKIELERRIKILENKVENLQNVIKKTREYIEKLDEEDELKWSIECELLEILKEANMPTFMEVEELFREQREEGFNV